MPHRVPESWRAPALNLEMARGADALSRANRSLFVFLLQYHRVITIDLLLIPCSDEMASNAGPVVAMRPESEQEHFRLVELPPDLLVLLSSENPPM